MCYFYRAVNRIYPPDRIANRKDWPADKRLHEMLLRRMRPGSNVQNSTPL